MSANETLELLSKQWCSLQDLMKLTNLGRNSALKIRKEIITDLEDKGYKLPCGLIPMYEVVNKLNININYLQNMVRMEVK
ncbi:MAG: hypothetical protein IJY87_03820 [Bacilli bacterium]|nr:hypothetical protein [Bacilli bacterium]